MSDPVLGDYASIIDCAHKTAPKAESDAYGYSIGTRDIKGGRLILENAKPVSRETFDSWTQRAVPAPGDLVLAREAPVGQVGMVKSGHAVCLGQRTVLIQCKDGLDSSYLLYRLLGPELQQWMEDHSEGSTVKHINVADVRKMPLPDLPSLRDQRAIVGVLRSLDELIDTNMEIASDIEKLLTVTFEQFNFDVADEDSTLSDFVQVDPKLTVPKTGLAPYIDMSMLPTSSALVAKPQQRTPTGGRRFQNGDTLVARITPCLENGKTAFIDCLEGEEVGIGSTEYICLRSSPTMPAMWTYFLARSPRFREYAIRNMNGTSGRQRCASESIARYPIARPAPDSLTKFGEIADPLQTALRELMDEAEEARSSRDTLLPLLLSGKIKPNSAAKLLEGVTN